MYHTGFSYSNDHGNYVVRPIVPQDRSILEASFSELSAKSKYLRFFQSSNRLSKYQLDYLSSPDGKHHVAWGILDADSQLHKGVCAMRFIRLKDEQEVAEVAITVIDDYQGQGLSKVAFSVMNLLAARLEIMRFRHQVLHQNSVANQSLQKLGVLNSHVESGVYIKETPVFASADELPNDPQLAGLRKIMQLVQDRMNLF